MNEFLGFLSVLVGFLACVAGIVTFGFGLRRRNTELLRAGRWWVWVVLGAAVIGTAVMQRALLTHDFSLQYVAENNSRSTPLLFTITGMWSALEGSILLWTLILAGYIAVMVHHFRKRSDDPLVGWATLVCLVVAAFFFGLMLFTSADPFQHLATVITDGRGPNPLLQNHPLVAFHPPMLYLGYVGFTIPFSFAVAALITGRLGEGWLVETRRWTLFAWGFLTIGIVLGAWWSYEVLGWGGYWAWDPVENASFLPWITGTAYLHSVMVQERRGMLRVWNLSLLLATFSLTILGTFLTRSGVLSSVHAFSASALGAALLGFFALIVVVVIGLIGWRGDRLRSPGSIDSPVSREGAFLANNVLFGAFAFVVLLGTVFPLITEALNNEKITVGQPYFNRMTMPIGMTLLFLMAIAPVLPWRKAGAEVLRKRLLVPSWVGGVVVVGVALLGFRGWAPLAAFGLGGFAAGSALRQIVLATRRQGWRGLVGRANGGMIVHLGVVIVAVAFAATHSYAKRAEYPLRVGDSRTLAGHTITLVGLRPEVRHANRTCTVADIRIDGGKVYAPQICQYPSLATAVGTPSVDTGIKDDVYVTYVTSPRDASEPAVIGLIIQPLIGWLWFGGALMGIGTVLAAWPGRRRRNPTDPVSAPIGADRGEGDGDGDGDVEEKILEPVG